MRYRKGISLIILIITIIVILILAGSIIYIISQNNPVQSVMGAKRMSDIKAYRDELSLYISRQYSINPNFNPTTYSYPDIATIIPSISAADAQYFSVVGGNLAYSGTNETDLYAAQVVGIKIIQAGDYVSAKGVNKPRLVTGMTAVKWNSGTSTWDTVTDPDTDTSWYNYDTTNKMWANAKTIDGSMWVWIPRFKYSINSANSSSGFHTATQSTIDIVFEQNIPDKSIGVGYNNTGGASDYFTHPAFTFGSTELTGIWVAKFEASGTTNNVNIVPGASAITGLNISNAFTQSRNMETNSRYGWGITGSGIDTHLMKNMEWGAIAYLGHSKYGRNRAEITINTSSSYLTGGTGSYITNVNQSTTGNVYGIYDLSGSAFEVVAAYVNNGHANLNANGSSLISADAKYKNVYTIGATDSQANNYTQLVNIKGDAMYETSSGTGNTSWFTDNAYAAYYANAFFIRGGYRSSSTGSGLFCFSSTTGASGSFEGFRPVLIINNTL